MIVYIRKHDTQIRGKAQRVCAMIELDKYRSKIDQHDSIKKRKSFQFPLVLAWINANCEFTPINS